MAMGQGARTFLVFLSLVGLAAGLTACNAVQPGATSSPAPQGEATEPAAVQPGLGAAGGSGADSAGTFGDRGEIIPKADKEVIITQPPAPTDPLHQQIGDRDGVPGVGTPPPPPPPPSPLPTSGKDPYVKDLSHQD